VFVSVSPRLTERIEVSHLRRYESREPQRYTLSPCNQTQKPKTWVTRVPQPPLPLAFRPFTSPKSASSFPLSLSLSLSFFRSRNAAFKLSPIGSSGIVRSKGYLVANSNTAKPAEPVMDEPFE